MYVHIVLFFCFSPAARNIEYTVQSAFLALVGCIHGQHLTFPRSWLCYCSTSYVRIENIVCSSILRVPRAKYSHFTPLDV